MRSYKELLNENARNSGFRQLTEDESIRMKKALLGMYKDIATVCEEHGLTLMLGGGSCLGAVRHKGFIPWDDDIDMYMFRKDYEVLKELLVDGSLGDSYEFLYPTRDKDSLCMFMKIYKKGTRCVEAGCEYTDFPKGLSLDIFPIEGTSGNVLCRKMMGCVANTLRLSANMVYEATYPVSEATRRLTSKSGIGGMVFKVRRALGKVLSIVPHRKWVYWYESIVRNPRADGLVCIPTGRKLYGGEILSSSVFLPVRKAMFEGIEVNVPHKTEEYLSNLYGDDYMQLPPVEKRERHFIIEFDLPEI